MNTRPLLLFSSRCRAVWAGTLSRSFLLEVMQPLLFRSLLLSKLTPSEQVHPMGIWLARQFNTAVTGHCKPVRQKSSSQ
jgi:hypothetical protein